MDGKALLKQLAPTAASFLFSPAAGAVLAKAIEVFDMPPDADINDVRDAVRKGDFSGEQLLKIKELELSAQTKEKELGIRAEEIASADRDGARKMQMATNSRMPAVLTVIITIGFFGTLAAMFYMPEVKDSAPLMIMLGQLSAGWAAALAFWLGTTSGSKAKTDLLAQSSPVR